MSKKLGKKTKRQQINSKQEDQKEEAKLEENKTTLAEQYLIPEVSTIASTEEQLESLKDEKIQEFKIKKEEDKQSLNIEVTISELQQTENVEISETVEEEKKELLNESTDQFMLDDKFVQKMMPEVYETVIDTVEVETIVEKPIIIESLENKGSHIPLQVTQQSHLIESEKEEEEDDSLSQAEFMRFQEAQFRALRAKQEEQARWQQEQEELQRKEQMRIEIEKNMSHFITRNEVKQVEQMSPTKTRTSPMIVEETKEESIQRQEKKVEIPESRPETRKEPPQEESGITLQKVGLGLAVAAILVYAGAKFFWNRAPKKL